MLTAQFQKNFGKNLKELLRQTGMSQRELARRLNTSNSTVARWMSGDVTAIRSDLLFGLCDIFSVDPLYFCK